jgi:hypothetical protein
MADNVARSWTAPDDAGRHTYSGRSRLFLSIGSTFNEMDPFLLRSANSVKKPGPVTES